MVLARRERANPRKTAERVLQELHLSPDLVEKTEIAGPGFINFWLAGDQLASVHRRILSQGADYGRSDLGQGLEVNVEFVSANPTGPLHVGHGRQAALGDAIAVAARVDRSQGGPRVLLQRRRRPDRQPGAERAGAGARGAGRAGCRFPKADITASTSRRSRPPTSGSIPTTPAPSGSRTCAVWRCASCGRSRTSISRRSAWHSTSTSWSPRSTTDGKVDAVVGALGARGQTYENEGALWLRTTAYGDDKDRVMRKSDGTFTYFVPDVAYHVTKWERGFRRAINVQGADHHSTVTRVRAGLQALGMGVPPDYPGIRAAPDGDRDERRRGGQDLQARRQLRDRAGPDRRGRRRRGALLLPHAEGRLAARLRCGPGPGAERQEPGLLRPDGACPAERDLPHRRSDSRDR